MSISDSISRFTSYYSRNGFTATIRRAGIAFKRALFLNRMIVFYCDLANYAVRPVNIPKFLEIQRLTKETELNPQVLREITIFWNPKLAHRNIKERFAKGASLWLIKSGEQLAGYGWTLKGCTIGEYYFPMGPKDVQLFDFYVFPRFRGRALHWLLTAYILQALAAEGAGRAFADTGEWNEAQIASFKMTPFRTLGMVRSFRVFGYNFVSWHETEASEELQKDKVAPRGAVKTAGSND
jgi:Acetyltransferase (GNAT) family